MLHHPYTLPSAAAIKCAVLSAGTEDFFRMTLAVPLTQRDAVPVPGVNGKGLTSLSCLFRQITCCYLSLAPS